MLKSARHIDKRYAAKSLILLAFWGPPLFLNEIKGLAKCLIYKAFFGGPQILNEIKDLEPFFLSNPPRIFVSGIDNDHALLAHCFKHGQVIIKHDAVCFTD